MILYLGGFEGVWHQTTNMLDRRRRGSGKEQHVGMRCDAVAVCRALEAAGARRQGHPRKLPGHGGGKRGGKGGGSEDA